MNPAGKLFIITNFNFIKNWNVLRVKPNGVEEILSYQEINDLKNAILFCVGIYEIPVYYKLLHKNIFYLVNVTFVNLEEVC